MLFISAVGCALLLETDPGTSKCDRSLSEPTMECSVVSGIAPTDVTVVGELDESVIAAVLFGTAEVGNTLSHMAVVSEVLSDTVVTGMVVSNPAVEGVFSDTVVGSRAPSDTLVVGTPLLDMGNVTSSDRSVTGEP